ncbi:hypothetical protein EVAR_62936_1 [Eumeta japonica]|uniref:Uncharacterized protein n=1 Tax=Eumeta variegata TaxID=151549 RepID=A0A4C1ZGR0_EUMVA|nr:hypothetical protein EVAR_62936_1 [Eumeta japonica]
MNTRLLHNRHNIRMSHTAANTLQNKNDSARAVYYHTLTKYGREVSVSVERYAIPIRKTGNALVTPLALQVSMGGDDTTINVNAPSSPTLAAPTHYFYIQGFVKFIRVSPLCPATVIPILRYISITVTAADERDKLTILMVQGNGCTESWA